MPQAQQLIEGLVADHAALRHVLIVDDSSLQRRILRASLSHWGFEISEAESGEEALRICRDNPPDLVISDWMMPGIDGLAFCRAFREMTRDSYGYFILLTSKSEKDEIAHGLGAGADDFLTKPVNASELRARIHAGERLVRIERELTQKNRLVESALGELQNVYRSLDNDLIEAKKLQQSLVNERHRDFGAAEISLFLQHCGHVGGDLVGMYPVSETRIGLYGIDVSGKGVSSALVTARLAGYLSPVNPAQNIALRQMPCGAYVPRRPSDAIADLNRLTLSEIETEHFFTMLLADVDLTTGQVVFSQAGHPAPALQRANGTFEMVGHGGLPVGLIEDAEYEDVTLHMRPGDRLMIHSDGVTECEGADGALLGEDGVMRMLSELRHTHGLSCLESLIWKLAGYAKEDSFDDDISAALLEFKPSLPIG